MRAVLTILLLAVLSLDAQAQQVTTGGFGSTRLPGYGSGCTLSRSAATTVGIAACATADDTTFVIMPNTGQQAAYTKALTAWAVGTGNGCLDTGALGATKFIYLYQIQRSDTAVVDYLCTITFGSPTMPTSYDRKRFLGAVPMDGAGNILAFSQVGNNFIRALPVLDINIGTLTTSVAAQTLASVPNGYQVEARIRIGLFSAGTRSVLLSSPVETGVLATPASNASCNQLTTGTAEQCGELRLMTNTTQQINAQSNGASTTIQIVTVGWRDPLVSWQH